MESLLPVRFVEAIRREFNPASRVQKQENETMKLRLRILLVLGGLLLFAGGLWAPRFHQKNTLIAPTREGTRFAAPSSPWTEVQV
jgi:hypothetical protein